MDSAERHAILKNIVLGRGAGCLWDNLQNILDALWKVQENGKIERKTLEAHRARLRNHFVELEKLGCIQLMHSKSGGGLALLHITLLKREVSQTQRLARATCTIIKKAAPIEELKPVPPPPKAPEIPQSRCLLFIDIPNVCHYVVSSEKTEYQPAYLNFFRADWRLVRKICADITHVPLERQSCHLYTRVMESALEKFENHCRALKQSGIRVTTREGKDIDEMLVADIFFETLPYLQKGRQIQLILMSGDGDYTYALNRLLTMARTAGAELIVHVITWEHLLSPDLAKMVGGKIHSIETYLKKIDPLGATMLMERKQLKAAQAA